MSVEWPNRRVTREPTLAAFTATGWHLEWQHRAQCARLSEGWGPKTAPVTWGRQKIFGVRKFCGARIFFAARFFLGADPDCQRGFGRESEPHPVALVSLAPWAQVLIRHPNWLLRSVDARG